jgi:ATP-dependent DNA helicase RecG
VPTSDSFNSARSLAGQILAATPGDIAADIPSVVRQLQTSPAMDDVAVFVLWANSKRGHSVCVNLGCDPDFWPTLLPHDFILGVLNDTVMLYSRPESAAVLSSHPVTSHLLREGPGLWSIPSPALAMDPLRALIQDYPSHVTRSAANALRAATATNSAEADGPVLVTTDLLGGLILDVSFNSNLLKQLRSAGVSPAWEDRLARWRISEVDAPAAVPILAARGISISGLAASDLKRMNREDLGGTQPTLDALRAVPIDSLASIGPRRAQKFRAFGISTLFDLLMLAPRRYLDRSALKQMSAALSGEEGALVGRIQDATVNTARRFVRFQISDGTATVSATFFHSLWMAKRFKKGDTVILLGRIEEWRGRSRTVLQMTNPLMEIFTEDTVPVIPIYPQSGKQQISTWEIRRATEEALSRLAEVVDPLPEAMRSRLALVRRHDSISGVHFPRSLKEAADARTRLVFDEFLRLQLALIQARLTMEKELAVAQRPTGALTGKVRDSLPFPFTAAQERVWSEILADISSPAPMHRLLQGDVGSGKTLIAILALLAGIEGGHQGALMAPTEILATQLHAELEGRLNRAGLADSVTTALLTSKTRARDRRQILDGLSEGSIGIAVGTHSLIGEGVNFHSLGVVVIDEQHRFGVEQRAALRAKVATGAAPDMLVMTATPIPRTAAITAFGDLETSIIDELPPGRTPIETTWVRLRGEEHSATDAHWTDVLDEIAQGRQAFVVCPLVEGSEKLQAASAVNTFEALATGCLSGVRVILVHGQQSAEERATAMQRFIDGDADVLVSTTVIEVGVNIPNASRMVILDAERFGIAQLHQLRGRVGRGGHPSRCYLVANPTSTEGEQRLQALCDSTDGFYLSEVDLSLRGAGNILGSEQSGGVSDLRIADLIRDREVLEIARETAQALLAEDPHLAANHILREEVRAAVGEGQAEWLFKS